MVMKKEKVANERVCGLLSYIFIGIIWYFADEKMKKSSFAKFHAKQGVIFLISALIYSGVLNIIFRILFFPFLVTGGLAGGFGLWSIVNLLSYVPFIWMIIGIINALNGREKELPIIGKYAKNLSF